MLKKSSGNGLNLHLSSPNKKDGKPKNCDFKRPQGLPNIYEPLYHYTHTKNEKYIA